MIRTVTENPLYGLTICIAAYAAGLWLNRRLRSPLANPLFIAVALVTGAHHALGVPYETFNRGGKALTMLLPAATAALALLVYRRREAMKQALLPLAAGCLAGSAAAMASVQWLCGALGVDGTVTASMLPKSVTTPIAVSLSPSIGGVPSITTAVVIFTGMTGAVCAPLLIRLFRVKDPVAAGIAIGTCSHAIGTSRAVEIGEVEGAASGISIGAAGLMTALLFLVW